MSEPDNDYELDQKIQITFEGMPYWVMPRYRHHYIENNYERFSIRLLHNLMDSNSTLLDIGAHYGAYSLYAAKHRGSKVIALEPVEENFELLSKNIAANKLDGLIEAHNVAASDEDGESEFNIPWASDSAGFYEHPLAETFKKQKVQMWSVDKLVGNRKVDLIKIDTEGHELHVLNGLNKTLKNNPEVKLLIEANPDCLKNAGATVVDLLRKLSEDFDKEVYVVSEEHFTLYRLTDNIDDWVEYIGEHGYANILCVPKKDHHFGLFVSHSSDRGGAELALAEAADLMRKNNFFCHVIIPYGGDLEQVLVEKGISYSVLPYHFWSELMAGQSGLSFMERNRIDAEAAAEISSMCRKLHVQMVANNTMACPWGMPAAREQGLPLVWFVHEFGDIDHHIPFRYPITDIRRFIARESDLVLCCSNAVRDVVLAAEPNDHTYTTYNLLDLNRVVQLSDEPLSTQVFSDVADIKACIVGRVSEGKGQAIAVEAVGELQKLGIRAELAIVGGFNEADKRRLVKLASSLGVKDSIKFTGQQQNPYNIMRQADVSVTCAANEAFGRNTAEAMALGVPAIGTASGGTLELIRDGKTGLLFEPGDAKGLAKTMAKLHKNSALRVSIAKAAKKHVTELLALKPNLAKLGELLDGLDYSRDRVYGRIMMTENLEALRQEILEKRSLNGQLEQEIVRSRDLEATNLELLAAVQGLNDKQEAMLSSSSWRFTKPLRRSKSLASRAKRKAKRMLKATSQQSPASDLEHTKRQYAVIAEQFKSIERSKTTRGAIVLHLFYPDMWTTDFRDRLLGIADYAFDLFVTVPIGAKEAEVVIKKDFPSAHVFEAPNRGRDVLPFLQVAGQLRELGYEYVLKLHSKKSPQRVDGHEWLQDMLRKLLPEDASLMNQIITDLSSPKTGVVGPSGHYMALPVSTISYSLNRQNVFHVMNHAFSEEKAQQIDRSWWDYGFFEGTMFWIRLDSIESLVDIPIHSFDPEQGQTDGTLAHAVERALCLCAEILGKKIYESDAESVSELAYKTENVPEWSELYQGKRRKVTK